MMSYYTSMMSYIHIHDFLTISVITTISVRVAKCCKSSEGGPTLGATLEAGGKRRKEEERRGGKKRRGRRRSTGANPKPKQEQI